MYTHTHIMCMYMCVDMYVDMDVDVQGIITREMTFHHIFQLGLRSTDIHPQHNIHPHPHTLYIHVYTCVHTCIHMYVCMSVDTGARSRSWSRSPTATTARRHRQKLTFAEEFPILRRFDRQTNGSIFSTGNGRQAVFLHRWDLCNYSKYDHYYWRVRSIRTVRPPATHVII